MDLSSVYNDKKWFAGGLIFYAFLRLFSYTFPPESLINSSFSLFIAIITGVLIFKKKQLGWLVVAAELLLGGSGGFLSVGFLSLRTVLLVVSLGVYALRYFADICLLWQTKRTSLFVVGVFVACAARAAINGFLHHHPLQFVIGDTIPYALTLYYLPLQTLFSEESFKTVCKNLLFAGVVGNLFFSLGTFIFFSTGIDVLQGPYYHWFRDVAGGKITDLNFNFYRIVLNEQLLAVPLLLLALGDHIFSPASTESHQKKSSASYLIVVTAFLIVLAINLTRAYYLAFAAGLVLVCSRRYFRRWIIWSSVSLAVLCISFVLIHTIASRGQSLGLELFGLRLQSITSPSIEDSSLSRLLLLPNILTRIKVHPLLGQGLGDQVTVFSPVVHQTITTPQFDWGYFEMIDEFGFIGLIGWLVFCGYIVYELWNIRGSQLFRPLTTSIAALAIINITSPALFHVLGILWLTVVLSKIQQVKKQPVSELSLNLPQQFV